MQFNQTETGGKVESTVCFGPEFQGWKGIVHGGLVAAVLDEIMVKCAEFAGQPCVTAEIRVHYKKPVRVLNEYRFTARITGGRQKLITAESEMIDSEGRPVASAEGKLFVVKKQEKE